MEQAQAAQPLLAALIREVEAETGRPVDISPYLDASSSDDIAASLEIRPGVQTVEIRYRPARPFSDPSTEKSIAHELTHALMVYSRGYHIPCAPTEVPEYSVQTAAEVVDMIDDVIVDVTIHRRGFTIETPDHLEGVTNNVSVLEAATHRGQIDPYEDDPVRAEIRLVSSYLYAWAIPRYAQLAPPTVALFKRLTKRFPQVMKNEFVKAREIKKSFLANDVFTRDGRTKVVISALELWPIDERIYLSAISAA
jgi:hypothetical protein